MQMGKGLEFIIELDKNLSILTSGQEQRWVFVIPASIAYISFGNVLLD